MKDQNQTHEKWEAKVSAKLEKAMADQVWLLFEDFCGLNKWFPGLSQCHLIHGNNGEPGCIRYCSGFSITRANESRVSWSKERLVSIDRDQRTLSYEMVDSNIGFESYFSTIKVVPNGGGGCIIEWCFSLEPVAGWRKQDLVGKYEVGLQRMAEKIEAFVTNSSLSI